MAERAGKRSRKKAFIWNIIGSVVNAGATMVLTIVVTRLAGVEEGGILGLAFGLCQVFATIANYEVRPFQSTDLEEQFQFSEYYGLRIVTCTCMIILCAGYIFGLKYTGNKASVIFAICMFKMLDAFSDVFQGMFQQKDHLEYAGQALALRVFLSSVSYAVVLKITDNSVWAAWIMPVVSALCIVMFDMRIARHFVLHMVPKFNVIASKKIMIACLPFFASAFMNMFILNATKIQVDEIVPSLQGYWTPIYMPAAIINLFSIFAFRPMLTTLRAQWNEKKKRPFLNIIKALLGWVAIVTIGALIGAYWIGIPVLELLYGLTLESHKKALLIVLLGGGFNALATVLYYVITVMRRQYFLLLGDGITFVATLVITPFMVCHAALVGAALAYLCSMLIRFFGFTIITVYGYKKRMKM